MRRIALVMILLAGSCPAANWVIVEGGLSPDKKLAVAVFPQKTEFIDEADGTVLLVDAQKQKRIGPLEEVDSTGGTWGNTMKNVRCAWSRDGKILLVNFRTGRLMHNYQIYRISDRHAIPLSLPPDQTHPKGKIFEVLTTNSNAGATLSFSKDGSLIKQAYGFIPKEGHFDEDYSKYGLQGVEEWGLRFKYDFKEDGSIELKDITVNKDN